MPTALHKNARTTPAIRAEIAASDLPAQTLAQHYKVTVATIYKWQKRTDHQDRPHTAHRLQTTLTPEQETIVAYLKKTLRLPLDDLLAVTREFVCEDASRSGLDRCLRRHSVDSLNAPKLATPKEPGCLYMDVQYLPQLIDEKKPRCLFVAMDLTTRWVFAAVKKDKTAPIARRFLAALYKACPLKITQLLTSNGKAFTPLLFEEAGIYEFNQLCQTMGIARSRSVPKMFRVGVTPEPFNGRLSDVLNVFKSSGLNPEQDLEEVLLHCVDRYNHQISLPALKSQTPIQAMKQWHAAHPHLFHKRPYDRRGGDA